MVETFRECLHDHLDLAHLQELLADVRDGRTDVVERRAEAPSPFAAGLQFAFTAAHMYDNDQPAGAGEGAGRLDRELLEQIVRPERQDHLLDPRAVHQVERRLRGLGQPPRSPTEMGEWLRRLGDLTPAELEGPMAAFLQALEADGRAVRIELPRVAQSTRWVAVEDRALYEQAFFSPLPGTPGRGVGGEGSSTGTIAAPSPPTPLPLSTGGEGRMSDAEAAQAAGLAVLARFLATHALVGLDDVLARYPFEPDWARRQLEEWSRSGRVVEVRRAEAGPMQWSAPENLQQVQRGSLAILRREVVACPPPQYADFVLRWQGVHPAHQHGESAGLAEALTRLEGLPLAASLWEQAVLPARVPGYQRRWLDEWTAGGSGVWVCRGDDLAFVARETLPALAQPPQADSGPLDDQPARVLDALRARGASFVTDLAADTGLSPGGVRAALWALLRRGLVTNDRFDVIRRGEERPLDADPAHERPLARRPVLREVRRRTSQRPEGRWSVVAWGRPEPEAQAVFQAGLLLHRYGVVSREVALLDAWLPPWRILYEVFSRMELVGDVRRGYFVEGLSGAQFALPEASQQLQDLALPSTATAPAVLLHSQDPANLYGSGAPFDVPLLDGGTRPLLRRAGNWLVQRAGRPLLLIEQQGKRLTALPSASAEDLAAAVACLPGVCGVNATTRHKLTVDEWNGRPVTTTPGRELLQAAGFVRDYQAMTLYAAWR